MYSHTEVINMIKPLTCIICGEPVTIRPDAHLCVKHLPPAEVVKANLSQGE